MNCLCRRCWQHQGKQETAQREDEKHRQDTTNDHPNRVSQRHAHVSGLQPGFAYQPHFYDLREHHVAKQRKEKQWPIKGWQRREA